jgi:hypothetical protein
MVLEGTNVRPCSKLVVVYLKSMVVLTQPDTPLARVAHPPIDPIFIRNLARAPDVQSPHKSNEFMLFFLMESHLGVGTILDLFQRSRINILDAAPGLIIGGAEQNRTFGRQPSKSASRTFIPSI